MKVRERYRLRILGIDTSSKILSIALGDGPDIITEESYELGRQHSSLMIPKIKEMLDRSNLTIRDIDAFVVGLGPGSFTGMRVGVSAVKGLSLGADKPCTGIASMDAMALEAASRVTDPEKEKITPIIDAKRSQFYCAVYQKTKNGVKRVSAYLLLPLDRIIKKMKSEVLFLGDGLNLCGRTIKNRNEKAVFLNEKYWYPKAGNLIKLSWTNLKKRKKTDLSKLEPLYIYPKDCQVKK